MFEKVKLRLAIGKVNEYIEDLWHRQKQDQANEMKCRLLLNFTH